MSIATTQPAIVIIQQLGGVGRLRAMIGAKDIFCYDGGSTLVFKFKGCRKANCVKITINSSDTYDIEFLKIKRLEAVPAGTFHGIYNDGLISLFEEFTGLYLSI